MGLGRTAFGELYSLILRAPLTLAFLTQNLTYLELASLGHAPPLDDDFSPAASLQDVLRSLSDVRIEYSSHGIVYILPYFINVKTLSLRATRDFDDAPEVHTGRPRDAPLRLLEKLQLHDSLEMTNYILGEIPLPNLITLSLNKGSVTSLTQAPLPLLNLQSVRVDGALHEDPADANAVVFCSTLSSPSFSHLCL